MLCRIAEKLKGKDVRDDVYFVFSVQEEVGLRGAGAAAYGIKPDAAIVYDVTLTGDGIGAKPMACVVGGGAAIKLKNRSNEETGEILGASVEIVFKVSRLEHNPISN